MSFRGPMKRSHLRQVSAASLETLSSSRSVESPRQGSTHDLHSPAEEKFIPPGSVPLDRRQCTLWVHDETFSREEILFNQTAFSGTGVKTGDIIEILPARSSTSEGAHPDLGTRSLRDGHVDSSSTLHSDMTSRSKFKTPLQNRCLFVVKPLPQEIKTRNPKLEISITSSIANIFGLKNRNQVLLSVVDRGQCSASHVDISFRDQFMVRSDMWRLVMSELAGKVIFKGQKISFMGSIKATVKNIFIRGKKVLSGYFSPHTIPVFRSEAAKYVLFIQMSREMWDFDSEGTGDILFSRVINGFLPELFKRWASSEARHLVTIVLFTRVEYDVSAGGGVFSTLSSENFRSVSGPNHVPTRDFYRVVVNDMSSGHWTTILDELKRDFRTFLRDVSILKADDTETPTKNDAPPKAPTATVAGRPSTALRGNILEAIHLASAHLAYDHIDRDMVHTGTSIIVITPGSGVFEVSYESLASTTEALTNRGIAIDLVCLSPMPLHSVPLFKYKEPAPRPQSSALGDINEGGYSPERRESFVNFANRTPNISPRSTFPGSLLAMNARNQSSPNSEWSYGIPHWLDISYWNPDTYRESRRILKNDPNAPIPYTVTKRSKVFVPRVRMYEIQMMGVMESEQSNISIPYLLEGQGVSRGQTAGFGSGPASLAAPGRSRHQLSDSLRPEPYRQNMANPKGPTPGGSKRRTQKSVLSWMDQYDDNIFQAFPKPQRKHTRPRKRFSEPEVQASGLHERLSARSVTRLREHEIQSERDHSPHSFPRKIEPTGLATPVSPVSTKNVSPKKPSLKPLSTARTSKISRTISFALRGLGATPPRAQASTEVNVEHAKALPMFNQKPPVTTSADWRNADSRSSSDAGSVSTSGSTATAEAQPPTPQRPVRNTAITPSRPISIKVPPKKPSGDGEQADRSESLSSTVTEIPLHDARHERQARKLGPRFEMTMRDYSAKSPPGKALAHWVRSINPCNTPREVLRDTTWFGRWQHAYPRPPHVAVVKWKSLKSPAILPLTTEEFPTLNELSSDYLQTPYRVFPNDDAEGFEAPKTRGILMRELISLRLSHGFQIVVGKNVAEASGQYALESLNVFDTSNLERDGTYIFLSKGNTIHRLICVDSLEIEVTRFTHQNSSALNRYRKGGRIPYSPAIRTILNSEYEVKNLELDSTVEEYNWNYADNYIAGHRDYLFNPAQQLHFWRVRYVLIPMRLQVTSRRHLQSFNEDNEEEIHLLGISQLTHIWQRHKYVPPENRFESSNKKHVQNPLNIMYQTANPSEVVAAELDRIILTDPGHDNPPAQLLPELLERSNITLSSLAQIIQEDKGVRMMDRRWHWRLHYNCFIGFEFTTWLFQNFDDIHSREEAVEFGNELMQAGLFQHVEKRHNFRDGNYFYQISSEYRVSRPESRGSWFPQIRPDKSAPTTPATEQFKDSPASTNTHSRTGSLEESTNSSQPPNTPSKSKNKAAIMLSKTMKYDVDPRKRSNRTEVIDLHYDRLHNPENCFHIELTWMNTTPKLIEDTVMSWATTADKFGLKLVQVPIGEATSISETQPFRKPYRIRLKLPPPPKAPAPTIFNQNNNNAASFTQSSDSAPTTTTNDHLYFQKALLRKFDFVLDFEPRSAFPQDVEVSYSWGTPDYQYPQYIHRSGSILAQITDEGDFLLLANRLVSTRSPVSTTSRSAERRNAAPEHPVDRISPRLSPLIRPIHDSPMSPQLSMHPRPHPHPPHPHQHLHPHNQQHQHQPTNPPIIDTANLYRDPGHILSSLADFCADAHRLESFYAESMHITTRPASTSAGPAALNTSSSSLMDASIPSLELPASVVSHHIAASHSGGLNPPAPVRVASDGIVSTVGAAGGSTSGGGVTRPRRDSKSYKGSPRSGGLRPLRLS